MIDIDDVVEGYWAAAMWTESCNGTVAEHEGCRGEDCDASLQDVLVEDVIRADTWRAIHELCDRFVALCEREHPGITEGLDGGQFGHDLWLTRNHHGTGFWDRGLGERGNVLTKWAHAEGEAHLTVGDHGLVYHHE